jgi:hypothetical protein
MNLANIVHHAVKQPLRVHLALAAQREAVESSRSSDIGKHRLGGRQPPGIDEAPERLNQFCASSSGM